MYWEGVLRSLTSDLWAGVGAIFVLAVLYGLLAIIIKNLHFLDVKEQAGVINMIRICAGVVIAIVVLTLLGRAASVAFANRVPRQDVDKTSVYEQMDSHGQRDSR